MESYALLMGATLSAGTVLALAALGLLINEKAGIVNLGAEGMMLCAAIAGFAVTVHTGNTWLGFAAGMAAGALLAAVFGVLVIWLGTNQYATGLALSLFGVGFSAFVGINYVQAKMPELPKYAIPVLGDLPLVGPALFRQHPLVYGTILLAGAMVWFLYRTRAGLVLRSVGESPQSAHALGYPLLGAYLFGGVTMLQFHLQASGVQVASQLLSMLPYLATIVVLALISRNPAFIRINMPASLGKPFYPGS